MLRVEVYINRRRIAVADATNVSDLAAVSDYVCSAVTEASPVTGADQRTDGFAIRRHRRKQSAWALVAKMATRLAEGDRRRDEYLAARPAPPSTRSERGDRSDAT